MPSPTVKDIIRETKPDPGLWMGTIAAAAYLGINPLTLKQWRARGQGPKFHAEYTSDAHTRRNYWYSQADLDLFKRKDASVAQRVPLPRAGRPLGSRVKQHAPRHKFAYRYSKSGVPGVSVLTQPDGTTYYHAWISLLGTKTYIKTRIPTLEEATELRKAAEILKDACHGDREKEEELKNRLEVNKKAGRWDNIK